MLVSSITELPGLHSADKHQTSVVTIMDQSPGSKALQSHCSSPDPGITSSCWSQFQVFTQVKAVVGRQSISLGFQLRANEEDFLSSPFSRIEPSPRCCLSHSSEGKLGQCDWCGPVYLICVAYLLHLALGILFSFP